MAYQSDMDDALHRVTAATKRLTEAEEAVRDAQLNAGAAQAGLSEMRENAARDLGEIA